MTVLTTGPKGGNDRDGGISLRRIRARAKPSNIFGYGFLWLRLLFKAMRLKRPDLVVTLSDPPMLINVGHVLKRFKKTRHIHWCHDLYPDIFPALNVNMPNFMMDYFKRTTHEALKGADKIVVVGRCMAQTLINQGIDPAHITFIPNWPDYELSKPVRPLAANDEPHQIDGSKPFEHQIKDGPKFRVLYAGNIGRAHPVDIILDAAAMLDDEHPEIEFAFVGDGPRFDYIARERVRRGLNNIRLLPFQPQNRLREVMESGDIHLISVKDEALGMLVPCKLYSAFAVGRPSIFVGPVESEMGRVINDFRAGAVVSQHNAAELAHYIKTFRMNSEAWFAAHEGAVLAGNVFVPKESIEAWVQRAWSVVEPDVSNADVSKAEAKLAS